MSIGSLSVDECAASAMSDQGRRHVLKSAMAISGDRNGPNGVLYSDALYSRKKEPIYSRNIIV